MKKSILLLVTLLLIVSCKEKSKVEEAIEESSPVRMQVIRFEQDFFEAKPNELAGLKAKYPEFFPKGTPDEVWIEKQQNKDWRNLYAEVEKKYRDFSIQQTEIEELFAHIKYYFPKVKVPQIYTVIADMDYNNKAIYAQDKLILSLEMYLGSNHQFYVDIPDYIRQTFNEKQMLPDVVSAFSVHVNPAPKTKNFLGDMIYYGKELYLKDVLLPNHVDTDKIGYTEDQIKFCQENEYYIWSYFIDKQLLYSADSKLPSRFITMAPFSKFYLEIDNDTPGRIGQWVGWQIVKSYMENNPKTTIPQLLKLDAKTLFEQSKYKPKKNE